MKAIFPFFQWAETTWISKVINNSNWIFPAIEGVHIVALALLFGAAIALNLRVLGLTMRSRPIPQLAKELEPWTLCSLIIILVSGALLFVSEAVKSFYSTPFRIKIVLLASAIVFHYTVSWRLTHREQGRISPIVSKLAAVIAIALWISVGFAGRAIGFF